VAKPEEVVKRTVRDFVNRLFGGDPAPLMLHLAHHSKLAPRDIQRLKELIDPDKSDTKGA
jgi:BlaI family transcriptional regulator, penicillinase repressor